MYKIKKIISIIKIFYLMKEGYFAYKNKNYLEFLYKIIEIFEIIIIMMMMIIK
jgi:hypothetical protein